MAATRQIMKMEIKNPGSRSLADHASGVEDRVRE
jgi:hypothetical protein